MNGPTEAERQGLRQTVARLAADLQLDPDIQLWALGLSSSHCANDGEDGSASSYLC